MKTNDQLRHQLAEAIVRLATSQHGVVSSRQLLEVGYSPRMVRTDLRHGRLLELHRGVYRVGHEALPEGGREMAAILACGRTALVSHWDAAYLWGMLKRSDRIWPVHVSVVRRRCKRPGVRIHRFEHLSSLDCQDVDGIPVTSPARTLLDLASLAPSHTVRRAANEARIREILKLEDVIRVLDQYKRKKGAQTVREIADRLWQSGFTRSGAEDRLHNLIDQYRLPSAASNVQLHGFEVDALWEAESLIVEVDGEPFHGTPEARDRDRVRDSALRNEGFRVLRFTASDVVEVPEKVASAIRAALRDQRLSLSRR